MIEKEIQIPSNKKFGYLFSFLFLSAAIYLFFVSYIFLSLIFIFLSISFFLVSILKPSLLYFFNYLWMYFGFVIGKIISTIILSLIFYLIFTPISILMKCFGRDELRIRKKIYHTYWRVRDQIGTDHDSFKNQY